jgi:hypothetical protein
MKRRLPPGPGRWFASRFAVAVVLCSLAWSATAQPREARRGDLVLRSSTIASTQLNPATASRHGIQPAANQAVLDVVLLRGRQPRPIPAEVTASSRSRAGVRQEIAMREVRENDRVSYIGTYEFLPSEEVDLEIEARPLRPSQSRPLTLSYRDRPGG